MQPQPLAPSSTLARITLVLAYLWIIAVVVVTQFGAWLLPVFNATAPVGRTNALLGTLAAGLIAAPLVILIRVLSPSRARSTLLMWLCAAVFPLLLAPTRLIPPAASQLTVVAQVLVCTMLAAWLWRWRRRTAQTANPAGIALGAGLGAICALPWLLLGVPGSPLDVGLALVLGALVGLNFGLLATIWFVASAQRMAGRAATIGIGGFVLGATLLILMAGVHTNGVQIGLMLALPALGWVCAALGYAPEGQSWHPAAALIAGASAAPLAMLDSDSIGIVALDPALGRMFQGVGTVVAIGFVLTLVALLARNRFGVARRAAPWAVGALVLWGGALGALFAFGQPRFSGDGLFVILKDQADVSQAAAMPDYNARRQFVYTTLTTHATTTQADLRATLDRFGIAYTPYYLVNAIEVRGGLEARLVLLGRGDIDRILPSPHLRPLPTLPVPMTGTLQRPTTPAWNLTNIGAVRVWQELGVRGKGIVIGQSDSGVQADHPELSATYRGRGGDNDYNWLDPWSGTRAPIDAGGHGTHTLGSIVGQSVGVAPEAEWFGCANLQRNIGNPALYLACMQFMLAPYPLDGNSFTDGDPLRSANVLNNSWGCPGDFEGCDATVLQPVVSALTNAGIFVVASAGNDGPRCSSVSAPIAIYADAFSVGAVNQQGQLGSFSSVGPVTADGSNRIKPDILAPGVAVLSALPGNTYGELDGTSMAGPHVAGVVALIWSANPKLLGDIPRTRQILAESATPFQPNTASASTDACLRTADTAARPNVIAGYGIVDAYAAVQQAIAAK